MAEYIVDVYSVDDMHLIFSLAPPGLAPFVWADLWAKNDVEISSFGGALFKKKFKQTNCPRHSIVFSKP